jgi:light-harvesting protein B-800-850 alpha chain
MNNAKMWLVVKPTVGIPLFLSGVAIASLLVHVFLILNTTWIGDYHQGSAAEEAALVTTTDTSYV